MQRIHTYYDLEHKELIVRALPFLEQQMFSDWVCPPKVTIGREYEDDFQVCVEYNNPKDEHEAASAHDAVDILQAFLLGVLWTIDNQKN